MSAGPAGAWTKRALDLVLSVPALVVLSPVMLAIAVAIRATMGRPVLFWQVRPGYKGTSFSIVKFRTMRDPLRPDGTIVPLNARVTRLGSILRRTSLDELPELWNVVKGEMSVVGPRPLLLEYLPRYSPEQARRHDVKPGITGLAQVKGRHLVGWDDRFVLDVWYVDHWSLRLDLRIIIATVGQLAGGQAVPDSTTENFWFGGTPVEARPHAQRTAE
ncbi:MAG TPA: sugar transferase [Candidatus Limnocylindrales bacterium]|nr:sugar transferase [Candidatus Limnocylindrales bacterium]